MNNIPPKLRIELSDDPNYQTCMRNVLLGDHTCERDPIKPYQAVEWEHVGTFGGKQIQKRWAIISICYLVHRGGLLDKEINLWIALNRASDEDLVEVSKSRDYFTERERLNAIYGENLVDNEIIPCEY